MTQKAPHHRPEPGENRLAADHAIRPQPPLTQTAIIDPIGTQTPHKIRLFEPSAWLPIRRSLLRFGGYAPDLRAAAKAGILKPNDDTNQNPTYASAAGGVISNADDLATWIRALVGGKVLNADSQRRWFESLEPEDPGKPDGQKYGYGITQISFGPNRLYFHGGEMPGYNSFIGSDPINEVTLIVWANLTLSLDGQLTANSIMLKVLDQIYVESPLKQRQ
jgi:CubicO group peptidase (beta-lactamase class C family)